MVNKVTDWTKRDNDADTAQDVGNAWWAIEELQMEIDALKAKTHEHVTHWELPSGGHAQCSVAAATTCDLWARLADIASASSAESATFDQLSEEVMELHLALRGKHTDSPAMEWLEIATIAANALSIRPAEEIAAAFADWQSRHGGKHKWPAPVLPVESSCAAQEQELATARKERDDWKAEALDWARRWDDRQTELVALRERCGRLAAWIRWEKANVPWLACSGIPGLEPGDLGEKNNEPRS